MDEKEPAADLLEQLVDQFDALWQQGNGPKWTEWLRQAGSAVDQTKLAKLLVPIELEYRRQRGDAIEPEQDYPEASAEQLALVRELLAPSLHEDATLAPNRAAVKVNAPKDIASQTIGPYKLLQKLGEGGMGEVWMAEQKEPVKRRVALKLIKTGLDNKQVIARFEAERQALAMMDHANIARVLDAGTTAQGQPPSAGYRLSKYVRRNKGLVASLASISAMLIGGFIGTSWFAVEANRAREDSDRNAIAANRAREESDLNASKAKEAKELAEQKTAELVIEKEKVVEQQRLSEKAQLETKAALEKSEAFLARSNYFLANARWNEQRPGEAMSILQRVPPKHRNFEWFYSRREFEGSDVTLLGHTSKVSSVAFSPDGQRIASQDDSGEEIE